MIFLITKTEIGTLDLLCIETTFSLFVFITDTL